jgi:hypothetical protein
VFSRRTLHDDHAAESPGIGTGTVGIPAQPAPCRPALPIQTSLRCCQRSAGGKLDHAFALALVRYPEVNLMFIDRLDARARRAATMKAIAQLNTVERRLVALFWHLAESWGHVGRDGVIVPLELSHRLLGELIGARRPTVSTALATLRRDGRLRRRADGGWLLAGDPPAPPDVAHERMILHRRRLIRDQPSPALTARL